MFLPMSLVQVICLGLCRQNIKRSHKHILIGETMNKESFLMEKKKKEKINPIFRYRA